MRGRATRASTGRNIGCAMKLTRRLRITGRVQGVGYREAMCDFAARLGVGGWVRNRTDGSVEAVVHGEPQDVEALVSWAQRGPPAARVSGFEIFEHTGEYPTFERRPTA